MGFISILFLLVPLLLVIGIVVYIIIMMKKNQEKQNFKITSQALFQFYLYLISFLTLGVLVIGIGLTAKALLSYKISIPFSYSLVQANDREEMMKFAEEEKEEVEFKECWQGEVLEVYEGRFCFDNSLRKTELITGITLIVSMSLLFVIHQIAINKIQKENLISWITKIYTFLSLILYSIVGLITIPISIYLLTNFLLFEPNPDMYSTPPSPAMTCTIMIVSIPLWIYFLRKTIQLKEK